jgi:PPP family 3-phenylpropionic acid transporter
MRSSIGQAGVAARLRLYYFISFAAFGAYIPYFPTWLEARGVHGLAMSSITSLMPFVGLLSPMLFGVTADVLGLRGSLLRIAVVGALLPFAAISAVAFLGAETGYRFVFVAIAVFAFFRAPMVTIADVSALEAGSGYGPTRLFGSLGFLLMAVVTGLVIDPARPAALPTSIAAALAVTLVASLALPSRVERAPEPILKDALQLVRRADFLSFLTVAFLWCGSHVAYDLCFSLHVRDLGGSSRVVGAYWGIGVASEIALMAFSPRLLSTSRPGRYFPIALIGAAVRFMVIANVRSLAVVGWLQPLHAVTFALMWVSCLEFVKFSVPPRLLATGQSLFAMASGLGSGAGMLVWGPMYSEGGGRVVFSAASVVAVTGALAALGLPAFRRPA